MSRSAPRRSAGHQPARSRHRPTGLARPWRVAGAILLGSLLAPLPAAGQGVTTAAIGGRILDASGRPIADARVEMLHVASGIAAFASSRPDGRFFLPNLRPGGPYRLRVSKLGFATRTRENLYLRLGQVRQADVTLRTQAVALPGLDVRVEANPEFNPSRMGASVLLDETTVERLPTLTRNYIEFAELSPLVKVSDEGISIAGQNFRFNSIQIDGALNQDVFGLSASGVAGGQANARPIPLEAIDQFEVLLAPFDVRQSGFTGGVLNAVTRSGTNEWKGSGFGFFRDESFVGDLTVDEVSRKPEQLDDIHFGGSLGGPIVKDRIHLFAAGEYERRRQPPPGFQVGVDNPLLTLIQPDSAQRMLDILSGLGADPGSFGPITLDNTLANAFVRLDAQLSDRHRLMVRHNYVGAWNDPPPNRLPGEPYELSSNGTNVETTNNSTVVELLSDLGDRLSNDLLVNAGFIRDNTAPVADYPRVEVDLASQFVQERRLRRVRAGADFFAQSNDLDQDILQVSDNLTLALGGHRLLFGVSLERFGIRRRFQPGALGSYRFSSLAALEANRPDRYDISLPQPGATDPTARFAVLQWGGYVQDEWTIGDRLNLRLGARIDVPVLTASPRDNPAVKEDFGLHTSDTPSGNLLFSPRFGFNLRLDDATQLRGGVGLFTGRPPFAWLANAFQNTGLETVFLSCEGENAPPFDPGAPPPTRCLDGSGPETGTPDINVFDPGFDFPQDFKFSLGLDRKLPFGFVGTTEVVLTDAVNQIFLEELNLGDAVLEKSPLNGYTDGLGFGQREVFGHPTVEGFAPNRRSDRFGSVIRVTNSDGNISYGLSAELRRRFGRRFGLRAGYAFGRSGDTQSLISSDVTTNFGLTPVAGDPNHPLRQPSLFDRPHKVVVNGTAHLLDRFGGTEITVLYVGQSGRPYSYVYQDDLNGDGFSGTGRTLDLGNDLFWVPSGTSDLPQGGVAERFVLQQLIAREKCLRENRGQIVPRNACRNPWSNQLDLRIGQTIRSGGTRVQVTFDMLNLLNFFSDGLGHVETARDNVKILRLTGRRSGLPLAPANPRDPLGVKFLGPIHQNPETGGIRGALPRVPDVPASQWQAQLGIRVSF
ncbi:MAG: TonB-dependent receptor domain-containing protein [Gemmatimonadota bacterium]